MTFEPIGAAAARVVSKIAPIALTEPGRVREPGWYDMPAGVYHADPAPEPSLSSSVAKVLIDRSPRHAWEMHPRLNPSAVADGDPTRPKEIGTAAHKLILGRGRDLVVIEAEDYKRQAARDQRAEAYQLGRAPILRCDLDTAEAIAVAAQRQLIEIPGCAGFAGATTELVAICRDLTGAWLRIAIDAFEDHGTHAVIWDVKTGEQPAAPEGLGRRIAGMGMEVQAALYERAVLTLRPELAGRLTFRWLFIENDDPHMAVVSELDNVGLGVGRKKVAAAIGAWNRCMAAGQWPGYPASIVIAEYPPYAEAAWLARELTDGSIAAALNDPFLNRSPWAAAPSRPIVEAC
ncbi:PD-(D/E)XK nuclease family protein [Chelatococcus reniformis]|uniref:PD-(D/E)XK endonuclease-like domain-containing protein n=1 Tax=Chelatococcus reniformis TaxID=1494448 RepID=A0A916XPW5_9HYPH|nr:PD-(D/E)XK nuclease family protein [Chelatococcus reniformis]GGC90684.1 hypothetical protein GCM10010994_55600 [Chelatococcus reniformis]